MKLFHFYRIADQSGVSGTGAVVEGVQFTNGWCALRWITDMSSICFYRSIEEVQAVHGHGGKTEIVIHDLEPLARSSHKPGDPRFNLLMDLIEEAARITTYDNDPFFSVEGLKKSIARMRALVDCLEKNVQPEARPAPPKTA